MSIEICGVPARLFAGAVVGAVLAGPAHGAVRTFALNWTAAPGAESIYISINNLEAGPTRSSTPVDGWDMQIESSNSGNVLKFNFPPFSGPVNPGNPNPFYGLMRLPGFTTGPGASIVDGTVVQASASFADSGPVSFGTAPGQWRLNSLNTFGFRFRSPSPGSSQVLHYGYGRILIGATPGDFRLVELTYQDTGGAAILVVPGPGAASVLCLAGAVGRRRRRR